MHWQFQGPGSRCLSFNKPVDIAVPTMMTTAQISIQGVTASPKKSRP
jgi:hypothetical protein